MLQDTYDEVERRDFTTLNDLTDHLRQVDEVTLLEVLDIYSEDLVDRFGEKIEEKFDTLIEEFGNNVKGHD